MGRTHYFKGRYVRYTVDYQDVEDKGNFLELMKAFFSGPIPNVLSHRKTKVPHLGTRNSNFIIAVSAILGVMFHYILCNFREFEMQFLTY